MIPCPMKKIPLNIGIFLLAAMPGTSGTFAQSSFCWQANTPLPGSAFTNCQAAFGGETVNRVTANPDSTAANPLPDQVFNGTSIAVATPTTWRLAVDASVSDYRQDMFVAEPGQSIPIVAASHVGMSDNLTVNWLGGPGVYSLRFVFRAHGSMATNFGTAAECITVSIVTAQHGQCVSLDGNSNPDIPTSYVQDFSNLPFGSTISPTIFFDADWFYPYIDPSDVSTIGADTVNGFANIDFGSTFELTDVVVLDGNGNPYSGVTIDSVNGFEYPLDPLNQAVTTSTPEPESPGLLALGALAIGAYAARKTRKVF